jgi:hypothetical protein
MGISCAAWRLFFGWGIVIGRWICLWALKHRGLGGFKALGGGGLGWRGARPGGGVVYANCKNISGL